MPNVHLTETMTRYAQAQVESGAYANISEVVRAGMRLLMEQDGGWTLADLRAAVQVGIDAAERGEVMAFDPEAFEPDAFAPDIIAEVDAIEAREAAARNRPAPAAAE